jgi:hypothetical protein
MVYISQEYESLASLSQSWAGRKLPGRRQKWRQIEGRERERESYLIQDVRQ